MAKKTRIDRRGTIRSLVTRFPPVARLHWKKQKLLTILANRRQWGREFHPPWTTATEIEMEHLSNYFLVTQASTEVLPAYIITE